MYESVYCTNLSTVTLHKMSIKHHFPPKRDKDITKNSAALRVFLTVNYLLRKNIQETTKVLCQTIGIQIRTNIDYQQMARVATSKERFNYLLAGVVC